MIINKEKPLYIQAVTGKLKVDNLGLADAHAHLYVKVEGNSANKNIEISNFSLIKEELQKFVSLGGSFVVDCQPGYCGRNVNILLQLSRQSGISVIAVTGFHKYEYYPKHSVLWKYNKKQAYNFFLDEIKNACKESSNVQVKAGAIKVAFIGCLENQYLILTEAALEAAMETNKPIIVHTEKGHNIGLFIDLALSRGVNPANVLLCHMDKNNNDDFHQELVEQGFFLEYDTFLRPKYYPRQVVYPLLRQLSKKHFLNKILIGTDIANNKMWESFAENGGYRGFYQDIENNLSQVKLDYKKVIPEISSNTVKFFSRI